MGETLMVIPCGACGGLLTCPFCGSNILRMGHLFWISLTTSVGGFVSITILKIKQMAYLFTSIFKWMIISLIALAIGKFIFTIIEIFFLRDFRIINQILWLMILVVLSLTLVVGFATPFLSEKNMESGTT